MMLDLWIKRVIVILMRQIWFMNILTRGCVLKLVWILLKYAILSFKWLIWAEKLFLLFIQSNINEQITDKCNQIKLEGGCIKVLGCFRWFLVTSGAYITIVSRPYYYIPILSFVWSFDTYIVSIWIYIVMYHISVILIW